MIYIYRKRLYNMMNTTSVALQDLGADRAEPAVAVEGKAVGAANAVVSLDTVVGPEQQPPARQWIEAPDRRAFGEGRKPRQDDRQRFCCGDVRRQCAAIARNVGDLLADDL